MRTRAFKQPLPRARAYLSPTWRNRTIFPSRYCRPTTTCSKTIALHSPGERKETNTRIARDFFLAANRRSAETAIGENRAENAKTYVRDLRNDADVSCVEYTRSPELGSGFKLSIT